MSRTIEQLNHHWANEGVVVNNAVTTSRLAQLETELGYFFPDEFKSYLLQMNGMEEGEADDSLFYFWDIDLIGQSKELTIKQDEETAFIAFADRIVIESIYMIEVKKIPFFSGRVAIKKAGFKIIEPNFHAFIENYMHQMEDALTKWEESISIKTGLDHLAKQWAPQTRLLMQV